MGADQFYEGSLLETATAVWRSATAHRFAPLMENKAYFDALASALHKAERSILILGWQFDPRTRLDPEGPPIRGRPGSATSRSWTFDC